MAATPIYDHANMLIIDPYKIDGTPALGMSSVAYTQSVSSIVAKIAQTQVGGCLLRSIRHHRRWVRIWPRDDRLLLASEVLGSSYRDIEERESREFLNKLTGSKMFSSNVGAAVNFFPHMCKRNAATCKPDFLARNDFIPTAESVLLHELVHAFRRVSRKFNDSSGPHLSGVLAAYTAKEEFLAVLVENIFQSEVKGELRGAHLFHVRLRPEFSNSIDFYRQDPRVLQMIEAFCGENKGFTRAIAKIEVPFNPIAAFLNDPVKVRALAR